MLVSLNRLLVDYGSSLWLALQYARSAQKRCVRANGAMVACLSLELRVWTNRGARAASAIKILIAANVNRVKRLPN
ncbi:hypothetical protein EOS_40360 [Caballeronia mineralivorans PML1(12)]|uniref:Uncharacterized protein n=1 Tax=Caballeronia mineralivorans PML1(12) TaxID=908627 RepID=A0A0J1CJN5_9BURK|nr:hypothetical protein EOS_40360 [Caballeronia mineralivorans PML1(12)]